MSRDLAAILAGELSLDPRHATAAVSLLEEQNTVPFVARYRCDLSGGLDEPSLRKLQMRYRQLKGLQQRAKEVLEQITSAGKLTDELREQIENADSYLKLHDLALPFAPARRTLATIAREKGLGPLAEQILAGDPAATPLAEAAKNYIDPTKMVANVEEVLVGVVHILSEYYTQQPDGREAARDIFRQTATCHCRKGDAPEDRCRAYREFFDFAERVHTVQAHRLLAINRGERHAALSVWIGVDEASIAKKLLDVFAIDANPFAPVLREALADALRRTVLPDLEKELRNEMTERAERHAVDVLAKNLRGFLRTPPLLNRAIMGILPGHRAGHGIAVIDASGNLVADAIIHTPAAGTLRDKAKAVLVQMAREHHVELIAIATGSGSREAEELISQLLTDSLKDLRYSIVSIVGTKAYMTSKEAKEEFPDRSPEVRAAVTIARRLRDPLAEMVKIDPRFLGIGPYQYDVRPKLLRGALGAVVESVVNEVGADLNTASARRLRYISGLDTATARLIVEKRKELGQFDTLFGLLQQEIIAPKALYQAAGFLTIEGGGEPLDATAVHIEQYDFARAVLKEIGYDVSALSDPVLRANLRQQLTRAGAAQLHEKLKVEKNIDVSATAIRQILHALRTVGEDPRKQLPHPILRRKMATMADLAPGTKLSGIVRNVVDFGAFIDVGLREDGLVHVSQLTREFVKDPRELVSPGEIVTCWLMNVDAQRQRISLTMLDPKDAPPPRPEPAAHRGSDRTHRPQRDTDRGGPRQGDRRPARGGEHRGRDHSPRHGGGRHDGRERFKPAAGSTLGDLLREVRKAPEGGGAADSSHVAKRPVKPPPKKAPPKPKSPSATEKPPTGE